MSIMEKLFGAAKPVTQAVPNQMPGQQPLPGATNNLQAPPNQQTHQSAQTSPNGVVPGDATKSAEESPMAKFTDLWQPPKTDPNAPTPESTGFSPEKMMEAAGKVDFSKVLNREDLQKISAGGEEAVTAFANALNKTAQTVFGQSTVVTQKLIEKAQQDTRASVMAEVSGMVRKQNLNDNLMQENPAFSNPALQPVIQALQDQLSQKYPKATTSELQNMAKDYLTGAAELIIPKSKESTGQGRKADQSVDWDKYFAT